MDYKTHTLVLVVGIAFMGMSVPSVHADTLQISNRVSSSVNTGGNQSLDGTDGEDCQAGRDGADGQDGQSVISTGVESYRTQIYTDVNGTGEYFYDFNSADSASSVPSSSLTHILGTTAAALPPAEVRTTLLTMLTNLLISYVNALR